MTRAVISRVLNLEIRVRAQVSPSGICDGRSGIDFATGFSPSSSLSLCI